ncbi:hypothetical protein RHGRI_028470 [Rhododendron griersonianum]|uniref:Inhibitor I9 domain-containing protein n=1 Tax=Rhododendron griersonianum TaxID=479676 RepID=A0AAV6IFY2_9ERIC|nr:hypothetical protein RHGRI_028470 [Rhododendron griersonianum]
MSVVNSIAGISSSSYVIFVNHHSTISLLSNEIEWLNARIFYSYEALGGFATLLTKGEADYIASMPSVTAVMEYQATIHLHTTRSPGFLHLNVDSGLWQDTEFADNIIIGASWTLVHGQKMKAFL